MTSLHAIWAFDKLHVFGEETQSAHRMPLSAAARSDAPRASPTGLDLQPPDARRRRPGPGPADKRWVSPDDLKILIGDAWSSFAALEATREELTLHLPAGANPRSGLAESETDPPDRADDIVTVRVPTLAFGVLDAVDLLGTAPRIGAPGFEPADTFRFWNGVAIFVLDLLARQRFVPSVHSSQTEFRGLWRVVLDDEPSAQRAAALIEAMPPACRAVTPAPADGAALVEGFLWRAVDALVRACMDRDELTHALRSLPATQQTPATRWLQSLVGDDARINLPIDECRQLHSQVSGWLSRLGPAVPPRAYRTCLRLEPPEVADVATEPSMHRDPWKLTIHVQALRSPTQVIDARELDHRAENGQPAVLPRPFDGAAREVRADLSKAARYFGPLEACAAEGGPLSLDLNLGEAYTFLRDAAPLLESEGFVVWLPEWWRHAGPRLRMRVDLRPEDAPSDPGSSRVGLDAIVSFDWQVALGDQLLSREELAELASAQSPLVRLRGDWAEVQPAELQRAVEFLSRNRSGRMSLFEALRQCYLADDLETGLPVVGIAAHGWIDRLLGAVDDERHYDSVEQPASFHGTLRPYQLRGIGWLAFLSRIGLGACLADDMGLGKTIQLIGLLLDERGDKSPQPGPTLLVVPTSLVGNWRKEIERFAPQLKAMIHHGTSRASGQEFLDEVSRHDVVICTYALTHRDFDLLAAVPWHRIALDEAQNIKNSASKQAAAIRALRAVHRVAMTGTPVENRLSELWSILDFLNPGYLGGATDFRRRFAVPIERHHDDDRATRLRQLIRPFILRRLKSDPDVIADLPEKMEMKVYCHLTREQAALYEAVVGDMLGQIDRSAGMQRRGLILATLIKLKQLCNHPAHYHGDSSALPGRSGKCERLVEMVDELLSEGDRALIFTQFRRMGDLLKRLLEEGLSQSVFFLHGGTPRAQRDQMIDRFQDPSERTRLFILSLRAGGFGLNLTAANHVFHFDRWWNPAVEDQATDRVHRVGQTRNVQVHKFICIGTLEERIDGMLEQKRSLAQNILGAGEDWLTELSTEQLKSLFALSREAVSED